LKDLIPPTTPIINVSKGIHVQTLTFMSQFVVSILNRNHPYVVLSGPSFAKELMLGFPTAVVAAASTLQLATLVQELFSSKTFRVYTSDDVRGVEVGGALKNVIAIAAGVVEGMGLGYNTQALVVTRGCNEIMKLACAMGGISPLTLAGLAGYGDLMLTCMGSLSRNRTVGVRLGKGEKLSDILATMDVAEGVATSEAAFKLSEQNKLELPIMRAVHDLIKGEFTRSEIVHRLNNYPLSSESYSFSQLLSSTDK